jgi:hypothetical protein
MPVIVPFSTTPLFTWDRGDPQIFVMILSGNVTGSTFDTSVNPPRGAHFKFELIQDAVGNRSFVWPTICKSPPIVGQQAGQTTVQEFIFVDGFLHPCAPPMYF